MRKCIIIAVLLFPFLINSMFGQARWRVASEPLEVRKTGTTETMGDISLTATTAGTIPAGATLIINMIPFRALITNDPTVTDRNCIGCPPDAVLLVSGFRSSLSIFFPTTANVAPGDQLVIRAIRTHVANTGLEFPGQIQAQLNVVPPDVIRFDTGQTVSIASPRPTIAMDSDEPLRFRQCKGGNGRFCVRVREGFPAAFTSWDQEASLSDTPPPDNGTQLRIVFKRVPEGVRVRAPLATSNNSLVLQLTSDEVKYGPGEIDFIYEVAESDLSEAESAEICFAVGVEVTEGPAGRGSATVQAQLFPEPLDLENPTEGPIVAFKDGLRNDPPDLALAVLKCR